MQYLPAPEQFELILLVLFSGFLGALIGLERERSDKPAGTRTQALVCSASALIVGVGNILGSTSDFGDPARALQAVITGIGFLGAGTIVHSMDGAGRTAGITTAATVFATAGIGVAVGAGAPIAAAGGTLGILLTLRGGYILENAAERVRSKARALREKDE